MATTDDETTDRHDESDREQFGNDHNLDGTHFIATHCTNCHTYVVKAPETTNPLCIDCRRALAHIDWQSGDNIGEHHPNPPTHNTTTLVPHHTLTHDTTPPHATPPALTTTYEPSTVPDGKGGWKVSGDTQHNILNTRGQWRWGCLYCLETGQADNPTHATALHKIHIGYACPGAPGLYPTEIRIRLARRKARETLYPNEVPPYTHNWEQYQ